MSVFRWASSFVVKSPQCTNEEQTLSAVCKADVGPKNRSWPSSSVFRWDCRAQSRAIRLRGISGREVGVDGVGVSFGDLEPSVPPAVPSVQDFSTCSGCSRFAGGCASRAFLSSRSNVRIRCSSSRIYVLEQGLYNSISPRLPDMDSIAARWDGWYHLLLSSPSGTTQSSPSLVHRLQALFSH